MPTYDKGSDWKRNRWAGTLSGPQLDATGRITSNGVLAQDGIGYRTGAGSTVTQASSKSTGVTINAKTGLITMNNASLADSTIVSFAVTNSAVGATDMVVLQHDSGGTLGSYTFNSSTFTAGAFQIDVQNVSGATLTDAIVLRFMVLKSVNA